MKPWHYGIVGLLAAVIVTPDGIAAAREVKDLQGVELATFKTLASIQCFSSLPDPSSLKGLKQADQVNRIQAMVETMVSDRGSEYFCKSMYADGFIAEPGSMLKAK